VKIKRFLRKKWGKDAVDEAIARKRANPKLDVLLTDGEYISLHAYTSALYREINPALRTGSAVEWTLVVDAAVQGLEKMRASGYVITGQLRRDASFNPKQINDLFPKNGFFEDKAFVSSSMKMDGIFPGNTEIRIFSKTGVNVRSISEYENEEEVIFSPNTRFKVVARTIDPTNKRHLIVLEEIK
jgi:hypothetical protein